MANVYWPTTVLGAAGMVYRGAVLLLGQVPADPISGGAGWVGAGLLGLVLGWLLLKHLPEKDRQLERLMEGRNAVVKDLSTSFEAALRETRADFRQALDAIMARYEKQTNELAAAIQREFERDERERHELRSRREARDSAKDLGKGGPA